MCSPGWRASCSPTCRRSPSCSAVISALSGGRSPPETSPRSAPASAGGCRCRGCARPPGSKRAAPGTRPGTIPNHVRRPKRTRLDVPRIGTSTSRGTSRRAASAVPAGQKATEAGPKLPSHRAPAAFVSLYRPAGRRKWWWYTYSCRTCGRHQLGRARELEQVAGVRKAGCGHRVSITIARVYGQQS